MPVVRISRKVAPEPVMDRPRAELVQALDRGIQARFRDVRPSDISVGRLGASRVGSLRRREEEIPRGIVHKELENELHLMKDISNEGWDSALYVVEGLSREREAGSIVGPIVAHEALWSRFQDSSAVRGLAARAMASLELERGGAGGMALEARPVLASEASCLRCHRRNKVGDPLGAVVYAFRTRPLLSDAGR
jgi:hypothetical protein